MENQIPLKMDVYYIKSDSSNGFIDIIESWDGSYYAETNISSLAGPDRQIHQGSDSFIRVKIEGSETNESLDRRISLLEKEVDDIIIELGSIDDPQEEKGAKDWLFSKEYTLSKLYFERHAQKL